MKAPRQNCHKCRPVATLNSSITWGLEIRSGSRLWRSCHLTATYTSTAPTLRKFEDIFASHEFLLSFRYLLSRLICHISTMANYPASIVWKWHLRPLNKFETELLARSMASSSVGFFVAWLGMMQKRRYSRQDLLIHMIGSSTTSFNVIRSCKVTVTNYRVSANFLSVCEYTILASRQIIAISSHERYIWTLLWRLQGPSIL